MLEKNDARAVKEAVKKVLDIDLTWEEVCRMQPITQTPHGPGLTILALQRGDHTILVWIKFSDVLGICVEAVKSCTW